MKIMIIKILIIDRRWWYDDDDDDYDDNCNDVHNDKSEHDGNRLIKIF